MNKNNYVTVKLSKGEMNVYDFGNIRLHAYRTDDPMADEVFVIEKNGRSVIIESPCFFDNEAALADYVKDMNVVGLLVAYHAAGGKFLPEVKKYATVSAKNYGENGGGKALIDNFTKAFGKPFDCEIHKITEILEAGKNTIGCIDFIVIPNGDAYTIEIPEINAVYTHMLGHDCHSIVAGAEHADAIEAELRGYIKKGVNLILTSHYTPEDLKDAQTKIDYLEDIKNIAANSENAEEFKEKVKSKYGNYSGDNYLQMSAGMFFKR